jgi:hypothetical protein
MYFAIRTVLTQWWVLALTVVTLLAVGSVAFGASDLAERRQDQNQNQVVNNYAVPEDEDFEVDQDRQQSRDQDQTNAPTTSPQTQTRTMEQVMMATSGAPIGSPVQNRNQVATSAELEQFVRAREQERLEDNTGVGVQERIRVQAEIATEAVTAAEPLLGSNGPRMSAVAAEVNQAFRGLAQRETALEERSRLQLFFFGHDEAQVALMQQEMEQNRVRIAEMRQLTANCDDCEPGVEEPLMAQLQHMEQEQERIERVADEAAARRGVFGFLFGWMW